MADPEVGDTITILDVLSVDLCARAIFDCVPIKHLVRSERVSRKWKRVVCDYIHGCTLGFYFYDYECDIVYHRVIQISDIYYRPDIVRLLRNILGKWGVSIDHIFTNLFHDDYFEIIAMYCPNLRKVAFRRVGESFPLKQIKKCKKLKSFDFMQRISESTLEKIFETLDCEKIKINENISVTGSFLKSIKSKNLTHLSLIKCQSLRVINLLSAIDNIRNVTDLVLVNNGQWVQDDVHLLLNEMSNLESLSLCAYGSTKSNEQFIESFSRLGKLKRLNLTLNHKVSDALLEALARWCHNLEYLNILLSSS